MWSVVNGGGTGARIAMAGFDIAGKTGTAQVVGLGKDTGKNKEQMEFEEGVDSYVPYAGKLKDNLDLTLAKVRSTMCNCGATSLRDFYKMARLTVASTVSIHEGGVHDDRAQDRLQVGPAEELALHQHE